MAKTTSEQKKQLKQYARALEDQVTWLTEGLEETSEIGLKHAERISRALDYLEPITGRDRNTTLDVVKAILLGEDEEIDKGN